MKEFLPRTQQYHIARKADVGAFTDERVELHRRTGDLYSRRVYCVCKPCNTGWMSQMQEKAKPYLVPMLRRQPIVHHRRAQTVLSAWVTMMTMVAEHVYRDKIAIPQCDRDFLRAHRKPPKHWRIWIGAHANQAFPLITHNVLEFAEEGVEVPNRARADGQNTHSTTICIGEHLLFHAMSSIPAYNLVRRWEPPAQFRAYLDQIWPVRDTVIGWPPQFALNDAGLELLADDFLNRANRFLRALDAKSAA